MFRGSSSKPKKVKPGDILGSGGTIVYGGHISSGERNPALVGTKKYITYSGILVNTSIVAAGVRWFLNLIAKPTWYAEPTDENNPEAVRLAELVEDIIYGLDSPWYRIVRRSGMFPFYGFSLAEWIAIRRKDGVIGYRDIATRPQSTIFRWDVADDGVILGMTQMAPSTNQELYLPRNKVVYCVDESLSDSPEGVGLLRQVYEPARVRRIYENLEGVAFQTDLSGVPVGRMPLSAMQEAIDEGELTPGLKAQLEAPVRAFVENHNRNPNLGLILDSRTYESGDAVKSPSGTRMWDVDILSGGSSSQGAVAAAITRLDFEMARILGIDGLLLGQERGTQALSRDKTHNFGLMVESTLTELKETFRNDVLKPLWAMNGWDEELMPWFKTDSVQYRDIESITGALAQMATAGAILAPDDPAINAVRDLVGLPRIDLDTAPGLDAMTPPDESLQSPIDDPSMESEGAPEISTESIPGQEDRVIVTQHFRRRPVRQAPPVTDEAPKKE